MFKELVIKNTKRGKKAVKTCNAIWGAVHKAYNLGAFNEPPRDELPPYVQTFCRKVGASFGLEVKQVEPVPLKHALWVSNHISWLDISVVGSVTQVFFISKAEIEKWPIFGALARAGGTLFIKRGSGDAGTVSDQIAKFMSEGSSVVFFPEATTTNGHKIKKLHGKLLQAAMDTGLPIQPIVTCYVDEDGKIANEVAYYGDMTMKQSLQQILDMKKVTAYVLPLDPIFPEDKSRGELTDILQDVMQEGLTRLQKQVLTEKPAEAIWD